MGIARFIARDPYVPTATDDELRELFARMDGVLDWSMTENGEVAVEYDHDLINDEMIEEALSGMGFKLKHVFDYPDLPMDASENLLDEEDQNKTERRLS